MDYSYLLAICHGIILITSTTGYVLLAANLDDFRSIAKKFVPAKLADRLADLASETSVKYKSEKHHSDSYDDNKTNSESAASKLHSKSFMKKYPKRTDYKTETQDNKKIIPKIIVNELIEKVKELLTERYSYLEKKKKVNDKSIIHSPKTSNIKQRKKSYKYHDRSKEKYSDAQITTNRYNTNRYKDTRIKHGRETYEISTTDTVPLFQEVNLMKTNDSYEDYITPKKDYDSDYVTENHRQELERKKTAIKLFHQKQNNVRPRTKKYDSVENSKGNDFEAVNDVKARTLSFLHDQETVMSRELDIHKKTSRKINTMIPKRDFYKVSSPNYYGKLPTVAEKYDFDEPIPEKDREPENLRPIQHPPSSVNRKIKLM